MNNFKFCPMHIANKVCVAFAMLAFIPSLSQAQVPTLSNPTVSIALDGYYQNEERLMTERVEGFGLGETELAFSASIDDMFFGKLTTVFEMHEGESEVNVEEAFIQTMALPNGFTLRAGRFLSDIGYLNNQHLHTDAFTSRPSAYRAFLGGHYFDDGIRVSYIAPTDLYWTLGAEVFAGNSIRAEDELGEREYDSTGVYTAFTKIGGDVSIESSWQLGLSYLRNENGQLIHQDHSEEVHEDEHDEAHSAAYTGLNTFIADFVFKWAPNGNYKYQHLTLSAEYFSVSDFMADDFDGEHLTDEDHEAEAKVGDRHNAWYISGVYQYSPSWSAGLRYGKLNSYALDEEHFEQQKLKETEFSVAWHNSHFSTVRLEVSHQSSEGFEQVHADNVISLQYVMTLGAHNAHQF